MTDADWVVWAAVVSAGAAVVQAVGAVVAIVYSGKLAREGAAREIAASEASRIREEEADRRAAERVARADQAAEERRSEDARVRHDEPIRIALGLAEAALTDLRSSRASFAKLNNSGNHVIYPTSEQTNAQLLHAQSAALVERCTDADSASAISRVAVVLRPFEGFGVQTARDWLQVLDPKIAGGDKAVGELVLQLAGRNGSEG